MVSGSEGGFNELGDNSDLETGALEIGILKQTYT